VEVTRIADGLWRWTGLHPDWTPADGGAEGWPREVGSVYLETPEAVVLIDPLIPPEERERFLEALDRDVERAGRPVQILLTVEWHGRSAGAIAERYGAPIGGEPPAGVQPFPVPPVDETLWWLPAYSALVTGDVLLGAAAGRVRVCPDSWLEGRSSPEEIRELLRPLLDRPLERLLVSHGEPVLRRGRDALAEALGHAPSAA
jgi:glyoxylase-like metal-dependent hydrolase (beta-lactamase superfamily II)